MNASAQHPSGAVLTGLGFASSGFNPGIHGPKMSGFWEDLKGFADTLVDYEQAQADREAADALIKAEKIRLEAERLRLEQDRLRQQGQSAGAQGEIISGVPNVVTFLGGAALVGGIAWAAFGK